MNCTKCGAAVSAGMRFCPGCGAIQATGTGSAGVSPAPSGLQTRFSGPAPPAAAVEYKGIGPRLAACIVDALLFFLGWLVASRVGGTGGNGFSLEFLPVVVAILLWGAYYVLLEGLLGGTVGKLVLGMRVVNSEGQVPGLTTSVTRNAMRVVDFLPFFYILGILATLVSRQKQRVGDRVAGTFVVSSRAAGLRIAFR